MKAILRQARANLRHRKLQAGLILVTLFATATLLTTALCTMRTAQGVYDRLFERTHGAHLWLYLDPGQVTLQEAGKAMMDLPGVEATTGVIRYLYADLFAGDEKIQGEQLREWPDEKNTVGTPLIVAGRAPRPGETNTFVMDRNEAVAYKVMVGDTIEVLTPGGRQPLDVIGLHVTPEICPYGHCSPNRHYLAQGALDAMSFEFSKDANLSRWAVGLRLQDPDQLGAVLQTVQQRLPKKALIDWIDWKLIRSFADSDLEIPRILLITFGVVSGLAAGVLIANAVSETVRAQTRQIGLLKAVGFTRWQLALIYLYESLALAVMASLAGLVVGSLIATTITSSLAAQFGEALVWPPFWIALIIPLVMVIMVSLFTLLPVRRATRLDVVEAIRNGAERPHRRMASLVHIPISISLAVNDILSRPLRSAFLILVLGLAVLMLTASLMINTTFRELFSNPGWGAIPDGDLFLMRSNYLSDAEVQSFFYTQPEVVASYTKGWTSFQLPGEDEILNATFWGGDLEAFRFPLVEGRIFTKPTEVVVAYTLSREQGLHLGDGFTILLGGQPALFRVVGIYRESNNQGRMVMLHPEAVKRVGLEAEPYGYVLSLRPEADVGVVKQRLCSIFGEQLEVKSTEDFRRPGWLSSVERMVVALPLVLVGIAAIGIFNSLWSGVRERWQELGLLKAVGVAPGQMALSVLAGAAMLALMGYVVGLPAGIVLIRFLMNSVAISFGFGPLNPRVDGVGLALILPLVLLAAGLGALIPAHQAGQTGIVEALRHE